MSWPFQAILGICWSLTVRGGTMRCLKATRSLQWHEPQRKPPCLWQERKGREVQAWSSMGCGAIQFSGVLRVRLSQSSIWGWSTFCHCIGLRHRWESVRSCHWSPSKDAWGPRSPESHTFTGRHAACPECNELPGALSHQMRRHWLFAGNKC